MGEIGEMERHILQAIDWQLCWREVSAEARLEEAASNGSWVAFRELAVAPPQGSAPQGPALGAEVADSKAVCALCAEEVD